MVNCRLTAHKVMAAYECTFVRSTCMHPFVMLGSKFKYMVDLLSDCVYNFLDIHYIHYLLACIVT